MSTNIERLRSALSGQYEILRELGRGGMAIVHLARDLRHDRLVAIKIMRPEISVQSNAQRFLREIKVAARLQHPHILAVHDSGRVGDDLYYVMPFVEGESLRERIAKGPLAVDAAVEIAREVADALDYAHAQGIIHRDIKPENILLTPGSGHTGGHAVVADFGIARAVELNEGEAAATATGVAIGSPAYMSPEQAMGFRDLDARTDIYSLGCVLYEMLTGKPPFGRDSARAAMAGHVAGAPLAISGDRTNVPPHILAAVERALAKHPDDRFATAGAFKEALRPDTATLSLSATRALLRSRPRLRLALVAAVVLAVAATAFVARPGSGASLGDRAAVLIADLDNVTGDPVFRHSLVSALAAGIGQSEHVTLISRSRLAETLARMQRAATDSVVDERTAREAAQREGWAAVVLPSIAVFDSSYVITARVVDPKSGTELVTKTVRARGKGAIIDALDVLARDMRRAFGESRLAVFRSSNPLPQVTTSSLDALEKYAAASRAWDLGRMDEARELALGAIALDSSFALAHVLIGRLFAWVNNPAEADRYFKRAMANAGRITDRERMWADAQIASARGDWELAATGYRLYIGRYPAFPPAWINLGTALMRGGQPREALAAFKEYMRLDSTSGAAYINTATSYAGLTRFDSAIVFYRKAFAARPEMETWFNVNHEYGMTLVKANRMDEARAAFQKMLQRTNPSDQARGHRSMALLDLAEGHPARAIPRLRTAIAINASLRERTSEVRNRVLLAGAHETAGDMTAARAEADQGYRLFETGYVDATFSSRIAMLLLRHGQLDRAARVLDSIRARQSAGNNAEHARAQLVAAQLLFQRGARDSARAVILQAAVLDSSAEVLAPMAAMLADAGDLRGAIDAERRIQEGHSNVGYEAQLYWNLARYRIGLLYERLGDNARARAEYETFLSEWADADQTLPSIVDTRARLKRLLTLQPKPEG